MTGLPEGLVRTPSSPSEGDPPCRHCFIPSWFAPSPATRPARRRSSRARRPPGRARSAARPGAGSRRRAAAPPPPARQRTGMMWRTAPEPSAAMILRPDTAAHRLTARSRDRERLRLVGGLRSVARRSHTAARVRRYDVLLYERAAAARAHLLELAATLERVAHPQPETLRRCDGCSPTGAPARSTTPTSPPRSCGGAGPHPTELDPLDPSALPSPWPSRRRLAASAGPESTNTRHTGGWGDKGAPSRGAPGGGRAGGTECNGAVDRNRGGRGPQLHSVLTPDARIGAVQCDGPDRQLRAVERAAFGE